MSKGDFPIWITGNILSKYFPGIFGNFFYFNNAHIRLSTEFIVFFFIGVEILLNIFFFKSKYHQSLLRRTLSEKFVFIH